MKKTALSLTLVAALLFSAVAGAIFTNFAKANPIGYVYYPTEPVITPPVITVYSPSQNQTYDSTSILLNFTVSKPEPWFSWYEEEHMSGTYLTVGRVLSYHYTLDGNESQTIPINDEFEYTLNPEETLDFSTSLNLTYGVHNMTIIVECETVYCTSPSDYYLVPVNGSSEVISFSVVEPSTFPIAPVAVASVASGAVAATGLLVYFKKRKC